MKLIKKLKRPAFRVLVMLVLATIIWGGYELYRFFDGKKLLGSKVLETYTATSTHFISNEVSMESLLSNIDRRVEAALKYKRELKRIDDEFQIVSMQFGDALNGVAITPGAWDVYIELALEEELVTYEELAEWQSQLPITSR